MTTRRKIYGTLMAGALMAIAAPALAADYNLIPLPQPVHEGNVTYITGGIGDAERQALKSDAKDYNLLITDANPKGQFTTDNDFTIMSKNGGEMISVDNAGPLFYAKLPPGEYKVTATNGNQREVKNVKISANREDYLHLIWRQS